MDFESMINAALHVPDSIQRAGCLRKIAEILLDYINVMERLHKAETDDLLKLAQEAEKRAESVRTLKEDPADVCHRWYSTKDRVPANSDDVYMMFVDWNQNHGLQRVGYYDSGHWYVLTDVPGCSAKYYTPDYWMPLFSFCEEEEKRS